MMKPQRRFVSHCAFTETARKRARGKHLLVRTLAASVALYQTKRVKGGRAREKVEEVEEKDYKKSTSTEEKEREERLSTDY